MFVEDLYSGVFDYVECESKVILMLKKLKKKKFNLKK